MVDSMRVSPQRTELAVARMAAGLRQKELAAMLDVGVRYLRACELGEMESKRLTAKAVALMRGK